MGLRSAVVASGARSAVASSRGMVWVAVVFSLNNLGVITPPSAEVAAPVTGELAEVLAVATHQPNQTITTTPNIGGVAVTGGAPQITASNPAGTVKTASPTANKSVTAGSTAVLITPSAGGNTISLRLTVMLGFKER